MIVKEITAPLLPGVSRWLWHRCPNGSGKSVRISLGSLVGWVLKWARNPQHDPEPALL